MIQNNQRPLLGKKITNNCQLFHMSKQTYGEERQWYAVHTYSGYEDAVARNLKQRIESFGMKDKIFNVIVPTEKKIKIKGGRKTETREKVFPGYVFVDISSRDIGHYVDRAKQKVAKELKLPEGYALILSGQF